MASTSILYMSFHAYRCDLRRVVLAVRSKLLVFFVTRKLTSYSEQQFNASLSYLFVPVLSAHNAKITLLF
jgi:hypothetical protein